MKESSDTIYAAVVSDVGLKRENNEDNYMILDAYNKEFDAHSEHFATVYLKNSRQWVTAGVFDGMGGGEKGELASCVAARSVINTTSSFIEETKEEDIKCEVRHAFMSANREIVAEREKSGILGTTGTVLCTNGTKLKVFHLGDSRAYLYRSNTLFAITKDQTLAELNLDAGVYSIDDPQIERDKHKLTEYIGCDPTSESIFPVESEWIDVKPEDAILLCSDGLYDMCTDAEIRAIMKQSPHPKIICERLVKAALEHGGADNITCLLIFFAA